MMNKNCILLELFRIDDPLTIFFNTVNEEWNKVITSKG